MAKKEKSYKPDWVPENAGEAFATKVVRGVDMEALLRNKSQGRKDKI